MQRWGGSFSGTWGFATTPPEHHSQGCRGDPVWLDFPAIAFGRPDEASAKGLGEVAKMSADITLEKLGDRLSAEDRETFTATMRLVTPWLLAEQDRFALMHGDYRLDNMLFD